MNERREAISIDEAARLSGLSPGVVRRCVRLGLVSTTLEEQDLAELRRVRRLTELEVNLEGVEIIVRMRRQIIALKSELARFRDLEFIGQERQS